MNYIYDIVLNFQDNYYQFFEWSRNDKIKNITRIPIYRVKDQDIHILKNNQVTVDSSFLEKLKEDNKKTKKLMCLVSNTQITLGLLFNHQGILIKRSSLIFEEEDEVNDFALNLEITSIPYQKNQTISHENKLRVEIEKKDLLISFIHNTKDLFLLKYLYYEYFKEECNSQEWIIKALTQELEKDWTKKQNDLYHLVKLMNKNNLMLKEKTSSS